MRKLQLLAIGLMFSMSFTSNAQISLQVNAQASVTVSAESIEIEVTILNREKSSEKALSQTASSIEDIMEFISETKGVSKMATTGLMVEGIWNKVEKKYEYESRETLRVKIDSLQSYDFVMKNLSKKGVNEVRTVSYNVASETAVEAQALKAALKNARIKADAMASEMGVKVGSPKSVIQLESSSTAAYYSVDKEPEDPISMLAGEVTHTVKITASFGVRN